MNRQKMVYCQLYTNTRTVADKKPKPVGKYTCASTYLIESDNKNNK